MRNPAWGAPRVAALLCVFFTSCVLRPDGTEAEIDRAVAFVPRYAAPFPERALPELSEAPDVRALVQRAVLANGDLEEAYFAWRAALHEVDVAASWPNGRAMFGLQTMFDGGGKAWFDRTTFTLGIDAMENLQLPHKTAQAAKVALAKARAAGARFVLQRADLQREVRTRWADYGAMAALRRLMVEEAALRRLEETAASASVRSGGGQAPLLVASTQVARATAEIARMDGELAAMRAELNGVLARPADTPLLPPATVAAASALPEDVAVGAAVAAANPALLAIGHDVEAAREALARARLEWWPDLNPSLGFTGGVAQMVGLGLMLPTTVVEIRAGIAAAAAMAAGAEARLRQAQAGRGAEAAAALALARAADAQLAVLDGPLRQAIAQTLAVQRRSYAAGAATVMELLGTEMARLELERRVVDAHAARARAVAVLDAAMGNDWDSEVKS